MKKIINLIEYDTDKATCLAKFHSAEYNMLGCTFHYQNELYYTKNNRYFLVKTLRIFFKYWKRAAFIVPKDNEKSLISFLNDHAENILKELFPDRIIEA